MDRTRLARELVRSALAFYDRALWKRFANDHALAIRLPGTDEPIFASILGEAGQEFGLSINRGARALATFRQMVDGDNPDEVADGWDLLSLTFEPVAGVPGPFAEMLREAKFTGRIAPWILVKEPGRKPRPTRRAENEALLMVLEGILRADRAGLLRPMPLAARGPAAIWTLTLDGKPTAPGVRAKFEEFGDDAAVPARGPVLLPDDLRELPHSKARWLLSAPLLPVGIAGDDRAVHASLIVDADGLDVLQMTPMFGIDVGLVAGELFDCCRGRNMVGITGLPAHVGFDQRGLHDALAPALAELSVTTDYEPSRPEIAGIVEQFGTMTGRPKSPRAGQVVPAEDDLEAWKRLDKSVSDAIVDLANGGNRTRKAGVRYFGRDPELLDQDQEGAMQCFMEWLVCHDRGQDGAGTLAERALAEGVLPAPMLQDLAARAAAPISLYRFAEVKRGEGVLLLDVLDGSEVFVHDRAMSESGEPGIVLFAKVHRAGRFHFITMLSAPLPMDSERQLARLESQGLEITPAGLAKAPHLLGRLWSWRAEQQRNPVRLTNTDGEPLVEIQVSFTAEDMALVREALRRREGVEESDDAFHWVGAGRNRVHLASMEFVGDELVATVNSEGRLERLRQWLRAVPGLREQDVTRRPFTDLPADDRGGSECAPEAMPDEALAAMREVMRSHYMRWLDDSIPALGGLTPRRAIGTPDGKRKVVRLIRSMGDPVGPSGPLTGAVPRAEMLRELGLADEAGG